MSSASRAASRFRSARISELVPGVVYERRILTRVRPGRAAAAALLLAATALAANLSAAASQPGPVHDIVYTGARAIDPETGLDAVRNIAIDGDRIAAVSAAPLKGRRVIDARGLVAGNVSALTVYGDLESFVIPDFQLTPQHDVRLWGSKNTAIAKVLSDMFASRPKVEIARCTGCGECKKVCPASAITLEHRHAEIDKKKCIACFCCQEFCPQGVITVHRTLIARVLNKMPAKKAK